MGYTDEDEYPLLNPFGADEGGSYQDPLGDEYSSAEYEFQRSKPGARGSWKQAVAVAIAVVLSASAAVATTSAVRSAAAPSKGASAPSAGYEDIDYMSPIGSRAKAGTGSGGDALEAFDEVKSGPPNSGGENEAEGQGPPDRSGRAAPADDEAAPDASADADFCDDVAHAHTGECVCEAIEDERGCQALPLCCHWENPDGRPSACRTKIGKTECALAGDPSQKGKTSKCETADDGKVSCTYTASDFLAFDSVSAFVDSESAREDLYQLVPVKVEVEYYPELVAGAPGVDGRGLYAFALYNGDGTNGTRSSFLVVAETDGTLRAVVSTTRKDRGRMSTHMDPVKVVDPDTLATMSNDWTLEAGYAYDWKWKAAGAEDDGLIRLNDRVIFSSHDIQRAAGADDYWQPTGPKESADIDPTFSRIDAATGDVLQKVSVPDCRDINHVQIIHSGATAIVSCRLTNSVHAINVETGAQKWIAGGDGGTLTLIDEDGVSHPPGASLWHGQHNAESYAEDGIYLFDNAYTGTGDDKDNDPVRTGSYPSRILAFTVDEPAQTATVTFAYAFQREFPYGYSEVFGDADLLPSGNVLSAWWPAVRSPQRDLLFDTRLVEVTPAKELAWSYTVFGAASLNCAADDYDENPMTLANCAQGISEGWKVYAPEKFFEAPLVYGAAVEHGHLAFASHASFKTVDPMPARWTLNGEDGAALETGTFDWLPHWRKTETVLEPEFLDAAATLVVTDPWGQASGIPVPRPDDAADSSASPSKGERNGAQSAP